jgi:hypothetical protein
MEEYFEEDEYDQPIKKEIREEIYWDYYEYEFEEKTTEWFLILGTIASLMIVICIILQNFLLVLIILLSSFILGTYARREPSIITYGLGRNGVKHGEAVFKYDTIKSFWVNEQRKHLIIESTRIIKPHIILPLADTDPEIIRKKLLPIITEKEYKETIGDIVSEFFGL